MQSTMTIVRNPQVKPEIDTPAASNPGATVELVPGGVSGGGREIRKKSNCYAVVVAVLQHCVR